MGGLLNTGHYFGTVHQRREVGPFALTYLVHQQERALPEHGHKNAFVCMLLGGGYRETAGLHSWEYGAFTSVYHPPSMEHRDSISAEGARFLTVEFAPDAYDGLGTDQSRLRSVQDLSGGEQTWTLFRIARHLLESANEDPFDLECAASDLMASVLRFGSKLPRNLRALRNAIAYLHAHYSESLTLQRVAEAAQVHPVYLGSIFRQEKQQTLGEYLNHLRTRQAALRLRQDGQLSAIALECGFYDQSHFTRTFKRITGLTPGQFRQSIV